jgi:hypothetical protein
MMVSSTSTSAIFPPPHLTARADGQPGQCEQKPRGDRVELPNVPERERRVRVGEHPAHPAVPRQRHVLDRVPARGHPRHQRAHLQPRVRAIVQPGFSGTGDRVAADLRWNWIPGQLGPTGEHLGE